MKIEFTKMHGCGNDYVYIDGGRFFIDKDKKPDVVRFMSDRHKGIGSDGVIFINPTESDASDFEMEMYNADGSRSEMCGNGIRCVAKYVYDKGLIDSAARSVNIESFGAVKHIELTIDNGCVTMATVDMGEPILKPSDIPVNMAGAGPVVQYPIEALGKEYKVTCVSMGNPHAIIYVDDVAEVDIEKIGPVLESHPIFPKKANIEFVQNIDRSHVKMRVWERGTGETQACGTGCSALTVAGVLNGYYDRDVSVEIQVLGGIINVNYASDGHVYMTGPATTVYEGVIEV
jgi:diaminopimelate epimerase